MVARPARNPWVLIIVSVLGAAAVAAVVLSLWSPGTPGVVSSQASPAPSSPSQGSASALRPPSSPSSVPTATAPAQDPDQAVTAATTALTSFIRESQKVLAAPEQAASDLDRYAVGAALEEVQAQAGEFVDLESRITGSSRVVSMTAVQVDVDSTPARVTLSTCLDDSGVVLISPENPDGVSGGGRVLNTYVLEESGGVWKVAEHSYPDRTEC